MEEPSRWPHTSELLDASLRMRPSRSVKKPGGTESLGEAALEDFYKRPSQGDYREDDPVAYELRLALQLLQRLEESLRSLAREESLDIPSGAGETLSSDLWALVLFAEWAEGVASTAFSSRYKREERRRRRMERGAL